MFRLDKNSKTIALKVDPRRDFSLLGFAFIKNIYKLILPSTYTIYLLISKYYLGIFIVNIVPFGLLFDTVIDPLCAVIIV